MSKFSTVTLNLGRKIDQPATLTLSLSQFNLLFCALYDASDRADERGAPHSAEDFRVLRRLIEDHEDLGARVRKAFVEDFPSLAETMKETDEAIERKAERDATGVYKAPGAAHRSIETPAERADRLAGEKADRETLTF